MKGALISPRRDGGAAVSSLRTPKTLVPLGTLPEPDDAHLSKESSCECF